MTPEKILLELGFQKSEIAVYFATLQIGMAPVSIIAKKAELKRPTAHEILKKLLEKGIAECFFKNKIRFYSVISPNALLERYKNHITAFENALPQMLALQNNIFKKPKISFFEGKENVKTLYLDVLTARQKEVLNYFLPGESYKYFGRDWVNTVHVAQRVQKGVKLRIIMPEDEWTEDYKKRQKSELREIRVIQKEQYTFKNEVYLYDDKMSLFSFEEDFGLLIESRDVFQTQKTLFELAWESALLK